MYVIIRYIEYMLYRQIQCIIHWTNRSIDDRQIYRQISQIDRWMDGRQKDKYIDKMTVAGKK